MLSVSLGHTIAVTILQLPPGRWIRNFVVPVIFIGDHCASMSLYPIVFATTSAPTFLATSSLRISTVAPVSGQTLTVASLGSLFWNSAINIKGIIGVGAPKRAKMSGPTSCPPWAVTDWTALT